MNICFITSLFGDRSRLDVPGLFSRDEKYDYYLFTDIDESIETSWDIINIKGFTDIKSPVKRSRYPKFQAHHLMERLDKKYDFIYYCDSFFSPNHNKDWIEICEHVSSHEFGFIQTRHRSPGVLKGGIKQEIIDIHNARKDTYESLKKTVNFFKLRNSNISLTYPQYFENTMFGYDTSNTMVTDFMDKFWDIYHKEDISIRDQPLWNFLLLEDSVTPITNDFFNPLRLFPNVFTAASQDQSDFYFQITGSYRRL